MKEMTFHMEIAPGVTFHALQNEKFKTACFSMSFVCPHKKETAALDALLPSVLLRATEHYPDIRSISSRLDELYGASFGTLVRRKGEIKLTGFFADFIEDAYLPQGEEVFPQMVDFLQEVLYAPYLENGCFCPAFVEGEKQNLINAIASSLNDKRSYAVTRLLEQMCATEDYGVPRLGRIEDVQAITPQSLWQRYRLLLETQRVEIFYSGRQDPKKAAACFARLFSGRPADLAVTPVKTQVIRSVQEPHTVTESLDVTQGKLVMGLRTGICQTDGDYPALLLLNTVFGSGTASKLFVHVREERSLCYYAGSSIEKYKGIMLISSGIAFEHFHEAKDAILAELKACQEGNISPEELEWAKLQLLSSLRAAQDSPAQLDDFYCGLAVCGGPDLPELMEQLRSLSAEDVARAANKLCLDTIYFLKGEDA